MKMFGFLRKLLMRMVGKNDVPDTADGIPVEDRIDNALNETARTQKRYQKILEVAGRMNLGECGDRHYRGLSIREIFTNIIMDDAELCDALVRLSNTGVIIQITDSYNNRAKIDDDGRTLRCYFDFPDCGKKLRRELRKWFNLPKNPAPKSADQETRQIAELRTWAETEADVGKNKIRRLIAKNQRRLANIEASLTELKSIPEKTGLAGAETPGHSAMIARLENRWRRISDALVNLGNDYDVLEENSRKMDAHILAAQAYLRAKQTLAECDDEEGLLQLGEIIAANLQAGYALKQWPVRPLPTCRMIPET